MQCRFIDTGFNNAFMNMAIDEAILHYCNIPVLRVYAWKPSALSIGYNQGLNEINLEKCKEFDIDIVRRITGGKAIFHDKEITYSFIFPEDLNLLPKEINESYREIANALVLALKKFGIEAEIKKTPERIKTSICFNSSNWYELLVNGKKISGSAQRRIHGKVLQHGSILTDFDYEKNASLFNSNNSDIINNLDNLKTRIASIKNESKNIKISYGYLAKAIKAGFKENFKLSMVKSSLSSGEIMLANKLLKEKYSTEDWNYQLISAVCKN